MLRNFLKIAFRNLFRRKLYTLLNVIGLASGLGCAVFIFSWVSDELSFDQHYTNTDRMYRVVAEVGTGDGNWHQSVTSLALGTAVFHEFPEVESYARLDKNDALVKYEDKQFIEDYILLSDSNFFDFFSAKMLLGDPSTALVKPYQIVLTESMAMKYFGNEDPLGKQLHIYQYDPEGTGADYEVTGVVADPPTNMHFTYNFVASIATIGSVDPDELSNWGNNSYHTYVTLREGTSPFALEAKFPDMVSTHIGEMMREFDVSFRFYLQPITDIHLQSDLMYEFQQNGSMEYVIIFLSVGLFILILAGINYVNLSTSIALERAKEMGVRKVMGAQSGNLMAQHLMETCMLILVSMVFAGLLVEMAKPLYYQLTGKYHLTFGIWQLALQLTIMSLPVAMLAGIFPAFYLSKLHASRALKGTSMKASNNNVRSFLVAFQFVVTLVILVGMIVVHDQLRYVQSKDLGYNKQHVLTIKTNGDSELAQGFEAFKNDLLLNPSIRYVARSSSGITGGLGNSNGRVLHDDGVEQFEKLYRLRVDYDYIPAMNMQMVAGRNFSRNFARDTVESFVINEQTARQFGWTAEEAIDKEMRFVGTDGRIVGVVKDFHFNSLHHAIEPVVLFLSTNYSRIAIKGKDNDQLLAVVKSGFQKHFPRSIFDYTFQDEALISSYSNDQKFAQIFNVFSGLSMLIAFLGLFGLVGYSINRRTREIGIRRVLGANTTQVLSTISARFIIIIVVAALVAFPVAGYFMDRWLDSFPYRIGLQAGHFLGAALLLVVVALGIIVLRSLKSIFTNPAVTLKDE